MTSVLFYVQHLRGVGHVFRSARIVRALVADGFDVTVVSGGMPIPGSPFGGARLEQLPPIRASDDTYKILLDEAGQIVTDDLKQSRRRRLVSLFDSMRPDILVTETFPLGRRNMRFELVPLIEHARSALPDLLIVGSVRDIVEPPTNLQKSASQLEFFQAYFDALLCHGDPGFASMFEAYPDACRIADRTYMTGLVVPEIPAEPLPEADRTDVLVSVGGGVFGHDVLRTAIAAKPQTSLSRRRWLLLTGPHMPAHIACEIKAACEAADIRHEPFRKDIAQTMRHAAVSVQMAGYNTVADALAAHCPMVALAFDDGKQQEQVLRARKLEQHGLAELLDIARLNAGTLARAIDAAARLPRPDIRFSLDGAQSTARILRQLLGTRRAS